MYGIQKTLYQFSKIATKFIAQCQVDKLLAILI